MYELYPATTTDFAEPVEGDDEFVGLFRPLLAKTRLEQLPLRYADQYTHTLVSLATTSARAEPARLKSPCLPGQDGLLCKRARLERPGFPVTLQWLWSCGERLFGLGA